MAGRPPALLDLGCHTGAAHPEPDPAFREREGRDAVGTAATYFAGIDVSKDALDACLPGPAGRPRAKPFANGPRGHAALAAWVDRDAEGGAVHFCMEATGPYSAALAAFLHAAGRH